MTRIEDIKDRDTLRAWLEETDQPCGVCIGLAHRAAMRVAPSFWHSTRPFASSTTASALMNLRPLLISGVAASFSDEVRLSTTAISYGATKSAFEMGNEALAAAVYSAFSAMGGRRGQTAARASKSIEMAAKASYSTHLAWDAFSHDAKLATQGSSPLLHPLWISQHHRDLPPSNIEFWNEVSEVWSGMGSGWHFWVIWYEAALDGRQLDLDMLTEIATQDDAFWQGTDDEVNARIAAIREKHDLLAEIRAMKVERDAWREKRSTSAPRSHNMPPELIGAPEAVSERVLVILDQLDAAEQELEKATPDPNRLQQIGKAILSAAQAILTYCGGLADTVAKGAAKAVGPPLGLWVLDRFVMNGRMRDFAERLLAFAGG